MSIYTYPSYKETAFNCMQCGAYASQYWSYITTAHHGTSGLPLSIPRYSGNIPEIYTICYCGYCKNISFWKNGELIFPNTGQVDQPNEDLPESVRKDYQEAADIVSRSPRGAAALLRLAIQKLCDELVEDEGDLNIKIGKLVKRGLNKKIQQALDIVRVVGNNAVHPGQIDLDDRPEIAHQLFVLVNMIAQQMITEPAEVDVMFESLPARAKESVQNRDSKK